MLTKLARQAFSLPELLTRAVRRERYEQPETYASVWDAIADTPDERRKE